MMSSPTTNSDSTPSPLPAPVLEGERGDEAGELIARLEKATGPDGGLDALIACHVKFPHLRPAKPDDHLEHQNGIPPSPSHIWCPTGFLLADPYTRSIDA